MNRELDALEKKNLIEKYFGEIIEITNEEIELLFGYLKGFERFRDFCNENE